MDRLLYPIPEAADRLGIGRSVLYELLRDGTIETVTIGRRRLVPAEALDHYVAQLRATPAAAAS